MPKVALVLIDIQKEYFPGGKCPLVDMDEVANNVCCILEGVRSIGGLIVHVRHEDPNLSSLFQLA